MQNLRISVLVTRASPSCTRFINCVHAHTHTHTHAHIQIISSEKNLQNLKNFSIGHVRVAQLHPFHKLCIHAHTHTRIHAQTHVQMISSEKNLQSLINFSIGHARVAQLHPFQKLCIHVRVNNITLKNECGTSIYSNYVNQLAAPILFVINCVYTSFFFHELCIHVCACIHKHTPTYTHKHIHKSHVQMDHTHTQIRTHTYAYVCQNDFFSVFVIVSHFCVYS